MFETEQQEWGDYTQAILGLGHFTGIPNCILDDPRLTSQELLAWVFIAKHQWGEKTASWPGMKRLAELLKMHSRSAQRHVHSLRDKGFLVIIERPGKTNVYKLRYPMPAADCSGGAYDEQASSARGQEATPAGGQPTTPVSPLGARFIPTPDTHAVPPTTPMSGEEYKEEYEVEPNKVSPSDYPPDFETFWEAYPLKKGKPGALDKWRALLRRNGKAPVSPETLLTAARHYRQECEAEGREARYILHAQTFLGRQRRWEEYLEPPKLAPASRPDRSPENVLRSGADYSELTRIMERASAMEET